jgi:opacity protein-like surface antigen
MEYDLSGVGTAPAFAVRLTRDLSPHVALEFGGVYSRPAQQFGPSTLFMPEAHVRYHWNPGRVSPYVGGGIGTAMVKSPFHTDWEPTMSVAGGAQVRLTNRVSVNGEFRLRAHEWRSTGTTSEVSAGLVWKLPAF